ncbi:hypothetical protein MNBD_UNCLBAC01-658 [hydrothermal vent metagenome]|uniref:Transporter n=1 Tax=hydrothermal vent metagenome TaxID=652676 RepID=A0A3B1DHU2_9ZZZZ
MREKKMFVWENSLSKGCSKILFLFIFFSLILSNSVGNKEAYGSDDFFHEHQHEDEIPSGVMEAHTHSQGEWMTTYRYMYMDMPEHYSGTKKQTVDQVHNSFMISPVNMTMEMHMLGLMYGVNDEFTAMLMVPYLIKDMEHRRRSDSKQFSTQSQGIGDVKLSGLYSLKKYMSQPIHLNVGVSFPTGSINRKYDTLAGADQPLPYPMQLGSGTVDFYPGITYLDHKNKWSWGSQAISTIRFGKNDQKYRLGNEYKMTSWIGYKWQDWINTSFRIKGNIWGNISGEDSRLNPTMVPTADSNRRGGERVDLFFGINLIGQKGILSEHRVDLEIGYPVYQNLDGPQLGVGIQGTLGWQKAW